MMRLRRNLVGILCCSLIGFGHLQADNSPRPFSIPEVTSWKGETGKVELSGRIVYQSKKLKPLAEQMVAEMKYVTQQPMHAVRGKAHKGDVMLCLVKDAELGEEGYALDVDNYLKISAPTIAGVRWGTKTLLQWCEQSSTNDRVKIAKGHVRDIPQYAVRGFMLDVGRKFFPMSYLRQLVQVMSYHKMNMLQLHLNDNAFRQFFGNSWKQTPSAFRLESEYFPELTAKDGSYGKDEFRDLQIFAAQHGVEIVPEIDAPAHSLAFTQYRPELASQEFGMDHLDIFKKETYSFLDSLYQEYLGGEDPVFVGKYMNIGTDEYSNAREDLVEQFRFFTNRYIQLVKHYGKTPILWGALTHAKGKTPIDSEGVVMNLWSNDYADPDSMKKEGFQLISMNDWDVYIVPGANYYQDYLNLEQLYRNWTPAKMGKIRFEELDDALMGGMFAVWNDQYGNGISVRDVYHRAYPALQTIANKCWVGTHTHASFETFDEKRLTLSEAPGVNLLGRIEAPIEMKQLLPNAQLNVSPQDVGYQHEVEFVVKCAEEDKGSVLTKSDNGIFYLAAPDNGFMAFERDGYLNHFNYQLPRKGTVKVKIELLPDATVLWIDGRVKDQLDIQSYFAPNKSDLYQNMPGRIEPMVYSSTWRNKMSYIRTLYFPMKETGNYKSRIENLRIRKRIN